VLCPWIDYLFVGTTHGSLLDVCSKCSRPSGDPWNRVSIVSFVVCWCIHCISPCPFFFWDDTYKIIVYTYSVGCYSAWHDIINSAGYSIKAENAYPTGASGLCSKLLMESVFVLFVCFLDLVFVHRYLIFDRYMYSNLGFPWFSNLGFPWFMCCVVQRTFTSYPFKL
jgi:hypothetical protein